MARLSPLSSAPRDCSRFAAADANRRSPPHPVTCGGRLNQSDARNAGIFSRRTNQTRRHLRGGANTAKYTSGVRECAVVTRETTVGLWREDGGIRGGYVRILGGDVRINSGYGRIHS
eukprot:8385327-Pyramimonas_sp.AAC.1